MKTKVVLSLILFISMLLHLPAYATVHIQTTASGFNYSSVMVNGSTTAKYDIVFVGDGFTSSASDQTRFNNAVNDASDAIRHKHPYMDNICSFNILRVNVISAQAGVDHPVSGVFKNTELNCTFGDNISSAERAIYSTTPDLVNEAADYAPAADAVYVLVNDEEYGCASGAIVYTSLNVSLKETVVHELGHFIGGLADEYACYFCDGRVEPAYTGPEPTQVNVTTQTSRSLVKWNSLINATTPLPTTVNSPAGVVGLWQGELYSGTGVYRPQTDCLMRALGLELCAVCTRKLNNNLHQYCNACERNPNSTLCIISRLRDRLIIERPYVFKIPMCCFCPLDIDGWRTQVELNVNVRDFTIGVKDGDGNDVETSVDTKAGNTIITFSEKKDQVYFLSISPNQQMKKAADVSVTLSRNGHQAQLF